MEKNKLKYYAFFLPQFHECEFNNEWWGKGFTEWENVKKATSLYDGHKQPQIPQDGYYDLSNIDTLKEQFSKSKQFGVDGFVFYHYWYEGKRPLKSIVDSMLENPDIDGHFSLCWANHSWTRSWSNRIGALDVLIEQTYEKNKAERELHFEFLHTVFSDKRYIKINGNPLFQIYRPELIPNLSEYITQLREYLLQKSNMEVHISSMITGWRYSWDFLNNFNSITFFQPSLALFSPKNIFDSKIKLSNSNLVTSIIRAIPERYKKVLYKIQDKYFNKIHVYDYDKIWSILIDQYKLSSNSSHLKVFPSSFVNFDNTPRYRNRAKIIRGFTPDKFGDYLLELSKKTIDLGNDIVFINAWNEWGEGMYLEADIQYGNKRLEKVLEVKKLFVNED